MEETKRLIIDACNLPLSIIIIGVGNEQFEMMKDLDADEGPLKDEQGRTAARDIVQFVKYNDYSHLGAQALAE